MVLSWNNFFRDPFSLPVQGGGVRTVETYPQLNEKSTIIFIVTYYKKILRDAINTTA